MVGAPCKEGRNGAVCSGKGTCAMGECLCFPGYTGDTCGHEETCVGGRRHGGGATGKAKGKGKAKGNKGRRR